MDDFGGDAATRMDVFLDELLHDREFRADIVRTEYARFGEAVRATDLSRQAFPTPEQRARGVFNEETEHELDVVTVMGVKLALMEVFLTERGVDYDATKVGMRAQDDRTLDGRDAGWDFSIALTLYPELETYVPEILPGRETIKNWVKKTLYRETCSFGSASHQNTIHANAISKGVDKVYREITRPGESRPSVRVSVEEGGDAAPVAPDEAEWNPLTGMLTGLQGEATVEAARLIAMRFGPRVALYWIFTTVGDYTGNDLLRTWGAGKVSSFGAVRKQMNRVLNRASDYVTTLCNDVDYQRFLTDEMGLVLAGMGGEELDATNTLGVSAQQTDIWRGPQA